MVSLITGEPVRADLTTKVYQPKRAVPFGTLCYGAPFEYDSLQHVKTRNCQGYNAVNLSDGTFVQFGEHHQVLKLKDEGEGDWEYET